MKRLSAPVGAALAVTCFIVACQGPASGPTVVAPLQASSTTLHHHTVKLPGGNHRKPHAASGALQDGGFESGGFTYWQQCGDVNAAITSAKAHAGTYSDLNGSASSEPNGYAGVCQQITIPTGGHLSFWVYEGTNETKTTYGDQEADLLDSSGNSIDTMFVEDANTGGWVQRTYDLS
ncbi:MAG TPA: hypothetical protein VK760_02030, partial [Candidatus Acidoferrales bacterium]|nr:hypothetical protein [Candidatus Acidoferrales bacterium]